MINFITKRLIWVPVTVFLIASSTFFLSKSIPYDPVDAMITLEHGESMIADQATAQSNDLYLAMSKKLGLDKPTFYFSLLPRHLSSNTHVQLPRNLQTNFDQLIEKGYRVEFAQKTHIYLQKK